MQRRQFLTTSLSPLALSACSGFVGNVSLDQVREVGGTLVPILVGTNRAVNSDRSLSSARGETLSFGRFDVAVPPDRKAGNMLLPSLALDPSRHFAVVNNQIFASDAMFRSTLASHLISRPKNKRNAVVFVHGYNTEYEKGLFRFAQFYTDLKMDEIPVHYSWPSGGKVLRYGYDRDSMLFARDGFQELLSNLLKSGVEKILIVAHSMGSMLVMESLREISIAGNKQLKNAINGVVLVSPDIDIDVFRSQVKKIGKLPQPFLVFSSKRDRVLQFASAEIYGHSQRLGALEMQGALKDLDVTLVDVTQYSNEMLGHSTAFTSPAFLKIASNMRTFSESFGARAGSIAENLPDSFMAVKDADTLQVGPL